MTVILIAVVIAALRKSFVDAQTRTALHVKLSWLRNRVGKYLISM